jgi:CRISPR-associated protein Cas1
MNITDSKTKQEITNIALDDIDGLILSGHGLWHTTNLLAALANNGIVVVITDKNYLPVGVLVSTSNNSLQGQRMIAQHDANIVTNKRIWQEIIQTKLAFQASLLEHYHSNKANSVKILVKNVKSGDPSNLEGQGARNYWQGWSESIPSFKREKTSNDMINIALNYGYTVLRTAVAKSILATGLHTGWGVNHCHPNNTMPLADDLMEPFRTMVDAKVHSLVDKQVINTETKELNPAIKKELVDIIYTDVLILDEHKPLINYLQTLAISLVKIYLGEGKILAFPELKKIQWQDFEYH